MRHHERTMYGHAYARAPPWRSIRVQRPDPYRAGQADGIPRQDTPKAAFGGVLDMRTLGMPVLEPFRSAALAFGLVHATLPSGIGRPTMVSQAYQLLKRRLYVRRASSKAEVDAADNRFSTTPCIGRLKGWRTTSEGHPHPRCRSP